MRMLLFFSLLLHFIYHSIFSVCICVIFACLYVITIVPLVRIKIKIKYTLEAAA